MRGVCRDWILPGDTGYEILPPCGGDEEWRDAPLLDA
jgi:hypothetical protein